MLQNTKHVQVFGPGGTVWDTANPTHAATRWPLVEGKPQPQIPLVSCLFQNSLFTPQVKKSGLFLKILK